MQSEFQIISHSFPPSELHKTLSQLLDPNDTSVGFEERGRRPKQRLGIDDPTVLVAIVTGTSAAVSALITGICNFVASRHDAGRKIVIRGSDGTSIEFPADIDQSKVVRLVELARELPGPRIELP